MLLEEQCQGGELALQHDLRAVHLADNNLRSLPEWLYRSLSAAIDHPATLNLSGNRWTLRALERPRDDNDLASAETPEEILNIFLKCASSESIDKHRVDGGWEDILREENAGAFADFLNRLFKTAEFNHPTLQATLKGKVQELMTTVLGSPEFRRLCFKIATDATESCGDGIALALNHMKLAELDHLSSAGVYGDPVLRDIGIGFSG